MNKNVNAKCKKIICNTKILNRMKIYYNFTKKQDLQSQTPAKKPAKIIVGGKNKWKTIFRMQI